MFIITVFKKLLLTVAFLGFIFSSSFSQEKFTISGYIRDSLSRETLIGASLQTKNPVKGISTNQYGYFSITLPKGQYVFFLSYIGYVPLEVELDLNQDLVRDFYLLSKSSLSQEIVVSSKRRDLNVKSAQMGQIDLSINKVKSLPVLFGEVDPMLVRETVVFMFVVEGQTKT